MGMGSVVQCLIRNCFDHHAEQDQESNESTDGPSYQCHRDESDRLHITAFHHLDVVGGESNMIASVTIADVDNPAIGNRQDNFSSLYLSETSLTTGSESNTSLREDCHDQFARNGFLEILSKLGIGHKKKRPYDVIVQPSNDPIGTLSNLSRRVPPGSPLIPATKFTMMKNTLDDIPTINLSEVVLPGSRIQREMSEIMKSKSVEKTYQEECVICLDVFDSSNPKILTLCGCGENMTSFHLPCLYQWIEQNGDCPYCREKLTWQEF